MEKNSIDKISAEFAGIVRAKMKDHLKKIILFGSHARGDFTEGSDYDFLVIVDERRKIYEEILLDIGNEFMDKYEVLIGDIVCDEKEWERKKRFPIGLNILQEGIEL
ncbi:MAG: nucleotidyltransferase domain-containing protein [Pseudomonadota bacterium]